MDNSKITIRIGQGLVILNGLVWIVAGIASLIRINQVAGTPTWILLVLSIGMLSYGVILIGLGIALASRRRFFFYASLALVALSIILPIFDDFGLADLLAVLPSVVAVIFLSFNKNNICGSQVST